MALKIVWTQQAVKGLNKVIQYLEEEWTDKEILNLEDKIKNLLNRIRNYPEICPRTGRIKHLHKGLIDKNNDLIYRIRTDKYLIEIINFRGTQQKPL